MILADRIMALRKKKGWSQEELAEAVGVTRQSVSKWESAASTPDLDKILKLAETFGVTCDYLLKDDNGGYIEEKEDDVKAAVMDNRISEEKPSTKDKRSARREEPEKMVTMEEAKAFLLAREEAAPKIAFGVSLCILSPVIMILLAGGAEYGVISAGEDKMGMLGAAILVAIVAVAVLILISESMKLSKYEYIEKDFIYLAADTESMVRLLKEDFAPEFRRKIMTGVFLCIVSVIPLFISGVVFNERDGFHFVVATAIILVVVSLAVNIFVKAGIVHESYETLLEEGDYTREEKDKVLDVISTVYWLGITAIYLGYSFLTFDWHISWVVWPVAGIVFVIVREIYKAVKR